MTTYLLTISIVLHFITFLILILVVKKVRNTLDYEQLERQKREIEDLLAFYSVELKEENERFLEQLLKANENERSEESIEEHVEEDPTNSIQTVEEKQKTPHPPVAEKAYEPSLEAQVLQLHHQGYDAKEIAKMLNKGHGEIELLLKFNVSH